MGDIPLYDEGGKRRTDPEAGTGMKYTLDKRIRIAAGTHRIFFGLIAEGCSKGFEVTLKEGEMYDLELKPLYRHDVKSYRIPSFLDGIKDSEVFLNGVALQ